jgi:hypothetical protein
MKMHELTISEPMFFEFPDGSSKTLVKGLGRVYGTPTFQIAKESYLVEIDNSFFVDGEEVRQLIVNARLSDFTLDDVISGECWVGISRVKPSVILKAGDEYRGFDFEPWAIGSIKLLEG